MADRVRQLVRQLDDDSLAKRQAAEQGLLGLGPDALQYLPRITPRTPAGVKEQLQRIRNALEKAAAEAIAKPSRVTLKGEMTLAEALQALQAQTGNRVVGYEGRPATVNVAFDGTLYWEALDQVLDQSQLDINPFGGERQVLVVTARPPEEAPRCGAAAYCGVFRIEPIRVEARRDLRNPILNGARVTVQVAWEPRVSPISLRQPLGGVELLDDSGKALTVPDRRGTLEAPIESGISAVEMGIPLLLPDRNVRRISRVKGALEAVLPGPVESFEFSELAQKRNESQRKAGVNVTFEELRKNLELFEARIRVEFDDPSGALESHRGWIHRNQAYLVDRAGKRIEHVGLQATRQEPTLIDLSYLFELPQGPEGLRFVYQTPVLILRTPAEYELADILLP